MGDDVRAILTNDAQQPPYVIRPPLLTFGFDVIRRNVALHLLPFHKALAVQQPFQRIDTVVEHRQLAGHGHDNRQQLIDGGIVEKCRALAHVANTCPIIFGIRSAHLIAP